MPIIKDRAPAFVGPLAVVIKPFQIEGVGFCVVRVAFCKSPLLLARKFQTKPFGNLTRNLFLNLEDVRRRSFR
ncbi:MAG: hypothetical protein DMF68_12200 [Acidobacteria bacterium]|nr:MAG: hypothetical protein DMF68_12200 [Acidobacteriota bacterium]